MSGNHDLDKVSISSSTSSKSSSDKDELNNFEDMVAKLEDHTEELTIETTSLNTSKERIIINARGTKFEVMLQHLTKVPNSRLENLKNLIENNQDPAEIGSLCDDFDLEKKEFYFNKDPQIVNLIINFYNPHSRKMHFNIAGTSLCVIQMIEEFKYWGIEYEDLFDICCWLRFTKEKEHILEEVKKEEDIIKKLNFQYDFGKNCFPKFRKVVWNLFDNPSSSILAKIFQLISIILIILPSITLVISTLPQYQVDQYLVLVNLTNLTNLDPSLYEIVNNTATNTVDVYKIVPADATVQRLFYVVEIITTSWFTLDYIARLWSTPLKKLYFMTKILNIIDLVSNLPFYLELIFAGYENIQDIKNMLRLFQIMRVVRLARHSTGLRSLGYTFSKSRNELLLLIVFLGICLLTFSSLAYFFEKDTNSQFNSIISSLWWALVTMTSVGYGDMLPSTVPGKIIAGACAILGLMIIAMPTAIISSNFSAFYAKKTKIEKTIKREEQKKKRAERKKKLNRRESIIGDKEIKEIKEKFGKKTRYLQILRNLFRKFIKQFQDEQKDKSMV